MTLLQRVIEKLDKIYSAIGALPPSPANYANYSTVRFWGSLHADLTLTTGVLALGTVQLPTWALPSGVTVKLARAGVKIGIVRHAGTIAGTNYINGATDMQAKKGVGGTFTTTLHLEDTSLLCRRETASAGNILETLNTGREFVGESDIKSEIPGIDGSLIYIQFDTTAPMASALHLHDVQVFMEFIVGA
jgi:hypothetical protein